MLRRGDALRQVHRIGAGRNAATAGADIDLHQHRQSNARIRRRRLDRRDLRRIVGAHRDLADARQRREPRELRGTHHLVAHQDVGNAAPGQRLGLRHLLHALADRAARHLQPGDHRRLVGLGMRPQLRPGRRKQFRHVVEIGLERIEVDQQCGRIDLVLAHAGSGWRWLQHGVLAPLGLPLRRRSARSRQPAWRRSSVPREREPRLGPRFREDDDAGHRCRGYRNVYLPERIHASALSRNSIRFSCSVIWKRNARCGSSKSQCG